MRVGTRFSNVLIGTSSCLVFVYSSQAGSSKKQAHFAVLSCGEDVYKIQFMGSLFIVCVCVCVHARACACLMYIICTCVLYSLSLNPFVPAGE